MKESLAGMASKKLALAGAVIGIIINDGVTRPAGMLWWHAISVAIVAFGYCVAQGLVDSAPEDPPKPPTTA